MGFWMSLNFSKSMNFLDDKFFEFFLDSRSRIF